MQFEDVSVNRYRRILEVDDDLDGVALGTRTEGEQRMFVLREVLANALESGNGHQPIVVERRRVEFWLNCAKICRKAFST